MPFSSKQYFYCQYLGDYKHHIVSFMFKNGKRMSLSAQGAGL
ncbi:hypothetical protein THERMOT_45 [Bathymodiolus thermophilus thioautotrophic gill symbiont]|nr:hypothetical protein THERMOT_45 [Bathymodiolus thermophilus thioautotrophic gill symbiont]